MLVCKAFAAAQALLHLSADLDFRADSASGHYALWSTAPLDRQQQRTGAYVVDIFDEVDEELRAERAQQLLKRYSGVILAAAVLIVGAAAGWQGWRWYEARQDRNAAAQYMAAISAWR